MATRTETNTLPSGTRIGFCCGLKAADRLLDDIEATCSRLAKHPQLGVARPEIGNECRLFPVGRYPILYRIIRNGIEVVRVSHGARRTDTLFP